MIDKQIGTKGIPDVHSNVFIHMSNIINGIIITTHITQSIIIKAMIRKTNFTRRPIINSDAVLSALIGYIPGALTAIRAISDDDSKYPESKIINKANIQNKKA